MTRNPESETPDEFLIHFLESGLTVRTNAGTYGSRVVRRGDELQVTAEVRALSADRLGVSPFDLVDDPDAQAALWGRAQFARGPWPEGEQKLERGGRDWIEARELARLAAHRLLDPAERAQALHHVEEVYGPALETSRILGKVYR